MTALPQSTRRKLSLLQLAAELGNVPPGKTCAVPYFYAGRRPTSITFAGERRRSALMALDEDPAVHSRSVLHLVES